MHTKENRCRTRGIAQHVQIPNITRTSLRKVTFIVRARKQWGCIMFSSSFGKWKLSVTSASLMIAFLNLQERSLGSVCEWEIWNMNAQLIALYEDRLEAESSQISSGKHVIRQFLKYAYFKVPAYFDRYGYVRFQTEVSLIDLQTLNRFFPLSR